MIRRFNEVCGRTIEKIPGQDRFAFAHSDSNDFYDLAEWAESGREYYGSVLLFFDFETGNVYQPFEKRRNILCSSPVYAGGLYYFLRGDCGEKRITLYRCFPERLLEPVTELNAGEADLYNLCVVGDPVHVISQRDSFECYYPERISFPAEPNEHAVFMEDGRIYFEAWVEEGWDEEKGCATDQYRYYSKVVVRDFQGRVLSEEVGALHQAADGTWWIA